MLGTWIVRSWIVQNLDRRRLGPAMMRKCKPPGNRAAKSMAASRTGTDNVPAYQKVRKFPGYTGIIAVAVVAILLAWCDLTQAAGTARVILLRGWFGVFSTGLDTLTDELKGLGINAGGRRAFELAERTSRNSP